MNRVASHDGESYTHAILDGNVSKLEVAWSANTGPMAPGPKNGLETVPIMIGETLYACSGFNQIVALDAEDGMTRWNYNILASHPCCR